MASVNYLKCKAGSGAAGAMLRHCDTEERLQHEHNNEHIDKALTPGNRQHGMSYNQTMAAIRDRLADLDSRPGANIRKDRVELFMLEIPIPEGHDPEKFTEMVIQEISNQYGSENVMGWYLHVDEIHEYVDHGEIKTSLAHIHVPVIPEIDGKLNGKAFSSRQQMQKLNKTIDERARQMGPGFLTGGPARKRTVEELKIASIKDAINTEERLRAELQDTREALQIAHKEAQTLKTENLSVRAENQSLKAQNAELRAEVQELDAALAAARSAAQQRKPKKRIFREPVVEVPPEEWTAVRERAALNSHLGTLELRDQALETKRMAEEVAVQMQQQAQQTLLEAQQQSHALLEDAQSVKRKLEEASAQVILERIRKDFPEVDRCFDSLDRYQGKPEPKPRHVEQGRWIRSIKEQDEGRPGNRSGSRVI